MRILMDEIDNIYDDIDKIGDEKINTNEEDW